MHGRPLDLDAVQAFVRIAELDSFTRAAEAMRTTQAAVSLKLKRLEERLRARPAGRDLPGLIARMTAQDPKLLTKFRIASPAPLLQSSDRRTLDTVIVRLHAG